MAFGFNNNNNNNNAASSFGGFGSSNNANTTTSGSLFGGGTATSGGFGGFGTGNANTSPFGAAKPAFGAPAAVTTPGSLFGGNNTSTSGGFGGGGGGAFGSTTAASSGFGGNTGGGLFGNKPATTGFGPTNAAGSLFGGSNTSGGFGSTANNANTSNPFGSGTATAANTGFGASNNNAGGGGFGGFGATGSAVITNNNGTAAVPFQPFSEKDGANGSTSTFQSITMQDPYKNKSFEELRVEDYAQGRRFGNSNGQAGGFGLSTGFGGFGATNTNSGGGAMFGGNNAATNTATSGNTGFGGFGGAANTASGFGGNAGGGLFGNKPTGGLFGGAANSGTTSGGFGSTTATGGGLFGSNTGGGFGSNAAPANTGGGLFGSNNAAQPQNNNPFGAPTGNAGGSLFGNKPAGGGLFGNNNTAGTGGGLFGSNPGQPVSSFGASTSNNTGGGLFGNANSQPPKPAFGGFGTANNTGSGFGGNANAAGGLFSNTNASNNNAGGGLFGNSNLNKPAGTSLFGNTTANTNNTGGGLFGSAAQPTGTGTGLFGGATNNNNTTGSLFGGQNKSSSGNLFGGGSQNNLQPNGGGLSLFGGQNQSQATSGSGLFGSNNMNNNNNQPNGGVFGNPNSNSGSFFGAPNLSQQQQQQQQTLLHASLTGSAYGNDQLFSSLTASSPPVGPLATPLSHARPAPRKTPSLLSSMRLNTPVYSPSPSLSRSVLGARGGYGLTYSNNGTPTTATIGGSSALSASSMALTPGATSLLRPAGFAAGGGRGLGKSASLSNLRDGTSLGGSQSNGLFRSRALSPLGPDNGAGGGFGAGQSGSVRRLKIDRGMRSDLFGSMDQSGGSGRDEDAVGPGQGKRVSFSSSRENSGVGGEGLGSREEGAGAGSALVRTETEESNEDAGSGPMRTAPHPTQAKMPEMSQLRNSNSNLTTVHEDDSVSARRSATATSSTKTASAETDAEAEAGDYTTSPPLSTLEKFSRHQLQNLPKFSVARRGIGRIDFGPCDLSSTPLEEICGGIVRLLPRSATVYQDDRSKPEVGKGLNVPSVISLEKSWPRASVGKPAKGDGGRVLTGRELEKHLARLKRVAGTKFVGYDAETGVWTFEVEHFTTYGLDDDEDDDREGEEVEKGSMSSPVDVDVDADVDDHSAEMADDTFEFKLEQRSRSQRAMTVPGGFDDEGDALQLDDYKEGGCNAHDGIDGMDYDDADLRMSGGFGERDMDDLFTSSAGGGPVQAPSPATIHRYHSSVLDEEEEQKRTINATTDPDAEMSDGEEPELPGAFVSDPKLLRSILKPSTIAPGFNAFASPERLATAPWQAQLEATLSPRKRDRVALRQALHTLPQPLLKGKEGEDEGNASPFKQSLLLGRSTLGGSAFAKKSTQKQSGPTAVSGRSTRAHPTGSPEDIALGKSKGFQNALQIMEELWQDPPGRGKKGAKGFEHPYAKKARFSDSSLSSREAAFHASIKPSFATNGTFVFATPVTASAGPATLLTTTMPPLVDESKKVHFTAFAPAEDLQALTVEVLKQNTLLEPSRTQEGLPAARVPEVSFARLVALLEQNDGGEGERLSLLQVQERRIWRLCSLLFDPLAETCPDLLRGVPEGLVESLSPRVQMDAFITFWAGLVAPNVQAALQNTQSAEERALLYLTMNDVNAASDVLAAARDYRLAAMVAQLPASSQDIRDAIKTQIAAWRARKDWSEMSAAVRALYSILAGEVCVVAGQPGAKEDRSEDFAIAERFELSWQQSFALRVCFAGHASLQEAIQTYCEDVDADREAVFPTTVWDELRRDDQLADKEDTLMGLLRLFVAHENNGAAGIAWAELFDQRIVSGNALSARLAWQMASLLSAKGLAVLSDEQMDRLTLDLAVELEDAGLLVTSIWVLLHIQDARSRENAVTATLQRNAGLIAAEERLVDVLKQDLLVPASTIWRAKALFAHSTHNYYAQVECLLHAGLVDEAHVVLCADVGPQAVIEDDLDALWKLLRAFPRRRESDAWRAGWQVYHDYVVLRRMIVPHREGREGKMALRALRTGLEGMMGTVSVDGRSLEQRVAGLEMRRFADEVERARGGEERERRDEDVVMGGGEGSEARNSMLGQYYRALGQVV